MYFFNGVGVKITYKEGFFNYILNSDIFSIIHFSKYLAGKDSSESILNIFYLFLNKNDLFKTF